MNKLNLTLCFGLAILFLSSCERPDYTDEIHDIWFVSQNSENQECTYGEYECQYGNSYYCGYPDSSDYRDWLPAEECANGCDNSTGKCIPKSADPCTPNPCGSIPNSTGVCSATDETAYSCGCNEGYEWNKTECKEKPLPECSPSSGTPCKDSTSGLTWSARASSDMTWYDAKSYCESYSEGGLSGWHLPTISELRTLIHNCSKTETGGTCGVTDECLSYSECRNDDCGGCTYDENNPGQYSKFGDASWFWSSSTRSDVGNFAWRVDFSYGYVYINIKTSTNYVRCVR